MILQKLRANDVYHPPPARPPAATAAMCQNSNSHQHATSSPIHAGLITPHGGCVSGLGDATMHRPDIDRYASWASRLSAHRLQNSAGLCQVRCNNSPPEPPIAAPTRPTLCHPIPFCHTKASVFVSDRFLDWIYFGVHFMFDSILGKSSLNWCVKLGWYEEKKNWSIDLNYFLKYCLLSVTMVSHIEMLNSIGSTKEFGITIVIIKSNVFGRWQIKRIKVFCLPTYILIQPPSAKGRYLKRKYIDLTDEPLKSWGKDI